MNPDEYKEYIMGRDRSMMFIEIENIKEFYKPKESQFFITPSGRYVNEEEIIQLLG